MTTTTAPAASSRIHGLDAVRAGALLLGILLHGLMPFVPADPSGQAWFVQDRSPDPLALPLVVVIHLFRMTLFMVLAGYFARVVVMRRGMLRFLRERTVRIALPVFAFWPVAVLPIAVVAVLWGSAHDVPVQTPEGQAFSPGHLWFLWTLYQCCLILAVVRYAARRLLPRSAERLANRMSALVGRPLGILVLAMPFMLAALWQGTTYAGIDQPQTLAPEAPSLLAYLSAFTAGWLLARRGDGLAPLAARWSTLLTCAVAGSAVVLLLAGLLGTRAPGGGWHVVLAATSAVTSGSWVYGLLGLAVAGRPLERFWVRYLADASYWMYLMHLPLLGGIQGLMTHLALPAAVKLAAALVATTAILLFTYDGFVRSTWIGAWINGRRHPPALLRRR